MSDDNTNPATEKRVITEKGYEPKTRLEKEEQHAFDTFSQPKKVGEISMNVKVYSPSRVYYDGLAFSITAENATGTFDILPKHHQFISLLDPCDLIIRTVQESNRTITISGGLLHVKADRVIVFLDI